MITEIIMNDFSKLEYLIEPSQSAEDDYFASLSDDIEPATNTAGYCLFTTIFIYPNGYQTTKVERKFTNLGLDRTITIYINNNGKRVS